MQTKPKSPKVPAQAEPGVVSGGSNPAGVIYIDQDADITSIASKVRAQSGKNLKIVVPKNSAALKSGVNLKLLAKAAHAKSKTLALITSDSKLISMAAVAKIPTAPNLSADPTSIVARASGIKVNHSEDGEIESDEEFAEEESASSKDLEEDLTIDGAELAGVAAAADSLEPESASKKLKKSKKEKTGDKKVPNFYDFRKKALIGLGVFLGLFLILMLILGSRRTAVIEIKANAERLDLNFSAKLNDASTGTTASELKVVKKSGSKAVTETTPATGSQDIGAKATGNMTLTIACSNVSGSPPQIPKGTKVSASNLNFITQTTTSLTTPSFNGGCKFTGSTTVVAESAGSQYNLTGRSYSVAGYSTVTGTGGQMSGGTSQVVKVVSAADVQTIKDKLANANSSTYKDELKSQFNSSQEVIEGSFKIELGTVQLTPAAGQQAEQVSGSVTATYSMYGVEKDELKKLVELKINDSKKDQSQSIIKNGLDELKITLVQNTDYSFVTTAYVGPSLDLDKIKQETAGKKKGEAIQYVNSIEGVDSSKVKISPFWSSSLPGVNKIDIKVDVAGA